MFEVCETITQLERSVFVGRSDYHILRQRPSLMDCATTLFSLGHSELLPLEASSRHAMLILYNVVQFVEH